MKPFHTLSSDLYLVLIIGIVSLYMLMFIFDQLSSNTIKYDKKNSLEMLLNEPLYTTIP